ncbi:MAG TPA: hypothetical protein VFL57_19530, partial [Bryobacteraceae bacterium]|nr:hypothetical protein [Bryobacteraceae bacterium]
VSMHESTMYRAIVLADNAAIYNDPNRINTDLARRLAVTAADIHRVAKKYLEPANRVVITTVPAGEGSRPAAAKSAAE